MSVTHCASTINSARNVDEPIARTLARADQVGQRRGCLVDVGVQVEQGLRAVAGVGGTMHQAERDGCEGGKGAHRRRRRRREAGGAKDVPGPQRGADYLVVSDRGAVADHCEEIAA